MRDFGNYEGSGMEGRIETVFFCGGVIEILPGERLYEWRSITGGEEKTQI